MIKNNNSKFISQDAEERLLKMIEKIFGTGANHEETSLFHSTKFTPKPRNLALRKAIADEPATTDLLCTPPSQLIAAGCDLNTEVIGERKVVCITQPTGRRIYNWQVEE